MATAPKPRASTPQFHPLSLARMLWKHKLKIVAGWAVLALIGCGVVLSLRPIYKAEAIVLVDSQKIPESFVASTVQVSLQDSLTTISQRVLSATRLQKIVNDFNLYPDKRHQLGFEQIAQQMRKDLAVTPVQGWGGGRSAAFRVSYEGYAANTVADVANTVAGLFIGENITNREQHAENTTEFLEAQLLQAKKSLEEQESNLSRFKLQHKGELPQQESALLGTLSRLQSELQGNQDAMNRAEQSKLMLDNTLSLTESSIRNLNRSIQAAAAATPASRPAISESGTPRPNTIEILRSRLNALRIRYSDEHPDVARLQSELAAAIQEEQAAGTPAPATPEARPARRAENVIPPQLIADLNREKERAQTMRLQLELIKKEIEERSAGRERILKSIAAYQAQVERLPIREQEMASVVRDYDMSKQNYSSLLAKKISAEMAGEMEKRQQSERFTLLEPARVPSAPIKPKRIVLCAASVLGSLVLCIAIAIGVELSKNSVLGEWELPPEWTVIGRISRIEPMIATTGSGHSGPRRSS